jgi:hypothetical protein
MTHVLFPGPQTGAAIYKRRSGPLAERIESSDHARADESDVNEDYLSECTDAGAGQHRHCAWRRHQLRQRHAIPDFFHRSAAGVKLSKRHRSLLAVIMTI